MTYFSNFVRLRENESLEQPHIIAADPPMKLPPEVERLAECFKKGKEISIGKEVDPKGGEKNITLKNRRLFVSGDSVANYLLGRSVRHLDLVTDAHPDEVEKLCKGHKPPFEIIRADKTKGLTKVRVGGMEFDIHTLRGSEGREDAGPAYTSELKHDALRRDFTLDALYYEISTDKITDPVGGIGHLRDGIVKFIGSAKEKLLRDPSIAYRYARWVAKLPNGKIDPDAEEAIKSNQDNDFNPTKCREALMAGFDDQHVDQKKYTETLKKLGLLETAFPGVRLIDNALFSRLTKGKTRPVALAAILLGNNPSEISKKLEKLHYTEREIHDCNFLLNLMNFNPENADEIRRKLVHTSLTKRQVIDWAKANKLNVTEIEKMLEKPAIERLQPQEDNKMLGFKTLLGMNFGHLADLSKNS